MKVFFGFEKSFYIKSLIYQGNDAVSLFVARVLAASHQALAIEAGGKVWLKIQGAPRLRAREQFYALLRKARRCKAAFERLSNAERLDSASLL